MNELNPTVHCRIMDHVKVLTDIPISDIQKYLADCQQKFETSQLYSSSRNEKFTDEDLRKSVFRPITDTKLFDLVDSTIISKLNSKENNAHTYTLRRNDVTHIKYVTGGFFKRHRDYLSTTSNLIEEFTLLVCVTPESDNASEGDVVEGGDTTIHTFGGSKTFDTTTPGSGILFRKDLEHEGMELIKGEKHVITANIWGTRKEQSKQVLLVTFPDTTMDVEGEEADVDNKPSIEEVANASTSYALPVDSLSGMLLTHVQWANRLAEQEGKDVPPVVTYECRDFDFQTFGVIEKILNQSYVDEKAIYDAKECLDYFGPFGYENILVNLAVEAKAVGAEKEGHTKKKDSAHDEPFDRDLIICETEARMRAVATAAQALGEEYYVPFKILFVEGFMEETDVPMMGAACLLGDHDNVFCLRKVCQKYDFEPSSFRDIHENSNIFKIMPDAVVDVIRSSVRPGGEVELFDGNHWDEGDVDPDDLSFEMRENGYGLSLKVGLRGYGDVKHSVIQSCLEEPINMLDDVSTIYLPGLTRLEEEADDSTSLFHRNEKGEVTFTEKEAERASDFIASFGLEERVKASLQKKRFVLPQKTDSIEAHFCNETVYGEMNILWVCGVIRMEAGVDITGNARTNKAARGKKFDAWPSKAARAKISKAKRRIMNERAMEDGGW